MLHNFLEFFNSIGFGIFILCFIIAIYYVLKLMVYLLEKLAKDVWKEDERAGTIALILLALSFLSVICNWLIEKGY